MLGLTERTVLGPSPIRTLPSALELPQVCRQSGSRALPPIRNWLPAPHPVPKAQFNRDEHTFESGSCQVFCPLLAPSSWRLRASRKGSVAHQFPMPLRQVMRLPDGIARLTFILTRWVQPILSQARASDSVATESPS